MRQERQRRRLEAVKDVGDRHVKRPGNCVQSASQHPIRGVFILLLLLAGYFDGGRDLDLTEADGKPLATISCGDVGN